MPLARRVVVIGSSVAGVRTAEALRSNGFDGSITIVGREDVDPYDKPPLSKQFLAGEQTANDIALLDVEDWSRLELERCLGREARSLNAKEKRVLLQSGEELDYDALVVTTGVRARKLSDTPNKFIHSIRELQDAETLKRLLHPGGRLVIVGGGFIGSEVASTALAAGMQVTIVEALATPFSRIMGAPVGSMLEQLHTQNGVTVIAGRTVKGFSSVNKRSCRVYLDNDVHLTASAVVVGIGCVPNTEWLEKSRIATADGVVADEYGRADALHSIYAAGDVARWFDRRSQTYRRIEHWTNAAQQAQIVAHNIMNPSDLQTLEKAPYFWSDQHGTKIQMTGHIGETDEVDIQSYNTATGRRDVAYYSSAGYLTAAVVFGWPRIMPKLRAAWEERATIADTRKLVEELVKSSV